MNRRSPSTPPSVRTEPGPYSDAAFDAFVQLNYTGWVRYTHLHVGGQEDAELIVSEVVLQLHESWEDVLGQLDNPSLHALALLRAEIERRRPEYVSDHLVENAAFLRAMDAPENGFALLAESLGVYSAIARLPERRFQVVLLRFVLGYSVKETALRMGVSPAVVDSLTHYARQSLARELELEQEQG